MFAGLGWGMVLISGIVCIYYNVIITWTLYYLFNSFRGVLPWARCDNEWNTDSCIFHVRGNESELAMGNATDESTVGATTTMATTMTEAVNSTIKRTTPSEEFWE